MGKRLIVGITLTLMAYSAAFVGGQQAWAQDALEYKPKESGKNAAKAKAEKKAEEKNAEKPKPAKVIEKPAQAKPKKKGFFGRLWGGVTSIGKSKKNKSDKSAEKSASKADPKSLEENAKPDLTKEKKAAEKARKKQAAIADRKAKKRAAAQAKKQKAAKKAADKKAKAEAKRKAEADKAYAEVEAFVKKLGESPDPKKLSSNYGNIRSNTDKILKHFNKEHPYYAGLALFRARAAGISSDRGNYEKYWIEALNAMRGKLQAEDSYKLLIEASDRAAQLGLVQPATAFADEAVMQSKALYGDRANKEIFMIQTRKIRGMAKSMNWEDIKDTLDEYMYEAKRSFTMADPERLEAIYTDCEFWHSYAPKRKKVYDKRLVMSEKLMALELAFDLHKVNLNYRDQRRFTDLINSIKQSYDL